MEPLAGNAKLAKLVSDHLISDGHRNIVLAVVDHEAEAYKVGHDGARARLCVDWRVVVQRLLERGKGGKVGAWGLVAVSL